MTSKFPIRLVTRIVAVVNLIIILVQAGLITVSAAHYTSTDDGAGYLVKTFGLRTIYALIWVYGGLTVVAFVIALDLLLAIILLTCSAEGANASTALERSWIWVYINVIFLVLGAAYIVCYPGLNIIALETCLRAISVCTVLSFINMLGKTTVYTPPCLAHAHSSINVMTFPNCEEPEKKKLSTGP